MTRFLFAVWPELFQRRSECAWCGRLLVRAGVLALGKPMSSGVCGNCRERLRTKWCREKEAERNGQVQQRAAR